MRWECRERFTRHDFKGNRQLAHASRHVRHARAVMHVAIANPRWRGKVRGHSRRMRKPQFYASGKRPMEFSEQVYLSWLLVVGALKSSKD